ncbi:MAG: MBL fold metallo-hydrolase [Desulfohalobiaceae bacterium]
MADKQRIREVLENFFFIRRGALNANHFVYRGESNILIDTGYLGALRETRELLDHLGLDFSRVDSILSTHCHCDHVGANQVIQQESGCDIAMHHIGRHFINTRDAWSTWWSYYRQEARFFRVDQGLGDGDTFSVGPHTFRVLYLPGHSADGLALYHPEEKLLLSSDSLWENDVAAITERVEGSRALFSLRESLQRLQGLDVQTVYPGHGRPFSDFRGAVEKGLSKVESYLGDKRKAGRDQIKKIMVYTLLMRKRIPEDRFFRDLMDTPWFPESVDLYFQGRYREIYRASIQDLLTKRAVFRKNGFFWPGVAP